MLLVTNLEIFKGHLNKSLGMVSLTLLHAFGTPFISLGCLIQPYIKTCSYSTRIYSVDQTGLKLRDLHASDS